MHDLEERIARWRTEIAKSMPLEKDALRELEEHLREQIETLVKKGLPPGEAFETSVEKLGHPRLLAREFLIASRDARRPSKPALAVYGALTLFSAGFLSLLCSGDRIDRLGTLLVSHVFAMTVGYAAVLGVGVLGVASQIKCWRTPYSRVAICELQSWVFPLIVVSAVLVPIGMVLGMFWAADHLGRAWGWDPVEWGALLILVWIYLNLAARFWPLLGNNLQRPLAVLSNVAVALGWFATAAFNRLTPHGSPIVWLTLAVAASLPALVLLLPARVDSNLGDGKHPRPIR